MQPTVSILTPVFNAEKYITATIQSALNQTYNKLEIIIVDDGSTDKSWDIIESYRERFPKIIRTFKQKNNGACAARNKAFELSSGQYIQYLDQDDLIASNKLEEQLKIFKKKGNGIITSCTWVRFKGKPNNEVIKRRKIDKDYKNPVDWLADSWSGLGTGHGSIWLTPREIIEKVGGWDETAGKNDDGDFFCRVLLNVKEIIYCPNTTFYFRDTENSVSKRFTYTACQRQLCSYENYVNYLGKELDSLKIKTALACNFSSFYSYVYPNYPDLLKRSEDDIISLGFNRFLPTGGKKFRRLTKLVGFKNAVYLRHKLSNIIK